MKTVADEMAFEAAGGAAATPEISGAQNVDSREKKLAECGDDASLRYRGVNVLVTDIELDKSGCLTGIVSEFSNVCSMHYEGLKLGQKISFRYLHVHERVKRS